MAQMRDIKRRMKSINSTMQITKAMYLVSSAKLKKAKDRVDTTRPYSDTVISSIQRILSSAKGVKHPFIEKREVKKTAYIIMSADRGLAGGFNSNVIKLAQSMMVSKENTEVVAFGSKSRDYFSKRDYNVIESFTGITEDPTYTDARMAGDMIIEKYKNGEIDEVKLIYTKFVSMMTQEPTVLTLLPVSIEEGETEEDKSLTLTEYEPSPEVVLDYLIPKYINGAIFGGLVESAASQQGARMTAMESATDNAEDIISSLELVYNRARQASITQEISEIVGGAEALK